MVFKNKKFLVFFISSIIFGLVFLLSYFLYPLNKTFQDAYYNFRQFVRGTNVSNKIVVVGIDEKTLSELGRFPFDRAYYATAIKNLSNSGASVIGIDVIFPDKSDTASDFKLSKAIKDSGNIVLGYSVDLASKSEFLTFEKPLDIFDKNAFNVGVLNPLVDRKTQKVYSIIPFNKTPEGDVEHFSIALLTAFYGKFFQDDNIVKEKGYYNNDSTKYFVVPSKGVFVPLEKKGKNSVLVNYISPKNFETISFLDAYNGKLPDLTDKIIIIGPTAEGIKDDFFTSVGKINGVYIHANMINTILTKNYLVYFDTIAELVLIFLLIFLAVSLNLWTGGRYLIFSNIFVILIFLLVYPIMLFTPFVLNYPTEAILASILSIIATNILKYVTEDRRKSKLLQALSEYVSKDIAQEILNTSGNINLDGEKKEVTIFFSDIAGFTTISEKLSPEKLVLFLREYLSEMSDVILDEGGFINKYEGDAIMALWGVFNDNEEHSRKACLSAIKQKVQLGALNMKFIQEGYQELEIRMGIHTGEAIIGNIGRPGRKMEFTALGDSVNLASRLEGVNKNYGTQICVSEDVFVSNKDFFEFRYLDKIRVKGKDKAVNIYELLSLKNDLSNEKKQIVFDFEKALELYYAKRFEEALKIFELLVNLGDKPSKTYENRCKQYLKTPPPEEWDFTWNFTEK